MTKMSAEQKVAAVERYLTSKNSSKAVEAEFGISHRYLLTLTMYLLLTHTDFESLSNDVTYSTEEDFLWIRDHYKQPNKTPYVNVFGHTPTR